MKNKKTTDFLIVSILSVLVSSIISMTSGASLPETVIIYSLTYIVFK